MELSPHRSGRDVDGEGGVGHHPVQHPIGCQGIGDIADPHAIGLDQILPDQLVRLLIEPFPEGGAGIRTGTAINAVQKAAFHPVGDRRRGRVAGVELSLRLDFCGGRRSLLRHGGGGEGKQQGE